MDEKNKTAWFQRKDLKPPKDLKSVFKSLRNYLAGNLKGTTRDERLAEQLIFLLFCKIQDEIQTKQEEPVSFQLHHPSGIILDERVKKLFVQLKDSFPMAFDEKDKINIDSYSLRFLTKLLQPFSISEASRDSIGDAFEIFLGPSLRGNKGQFFTPKNVVKTMVSILDPKPGESVIDPACGTGGFLIEVIKHLNDENEKNSASIVPLANIYGIDKDRFLAKIARLYLMILGVEYNPIFCENSLTDPENWGIESSSKIKQNSFDIVITNPPFGSKISIKNQGILNSFQLGHRWKKSKDKESGISIWTKTTSLLDSQPPQILFIELALSLLKDDGRLGIVLPDGIFGNPTDRYILEYLQTHSKILGIISCSPLTFLPFTHTKTSLLFLQKKKKVESYDFFMAIANNVGHDKNGKPSYKLDAHGNVLKNGNGFPILNDDFPEIISRFNLFTQVKTLDHSHLGFSFPSTSLRNNILIPEYYNPEIDTELSELERTGDYQLFTIERLVQEGIIEIRRGHEIGSKFYGTGSIPFVRTSDLINWEINIDPKKQVSEEIYLQYKQKQDIREGDILFVSDGTFLIGKSAMITKRDTKIIIQSHLKKIRVIERNFLDEYILLWALNTEIVQKQVKSKTFVQSTISTLGERMFELILPVPKALQRREELSREIRTIIEQKMKLRSRIRASLDISKV
ncbi:MAG: N-6 DNA methylase [Candidatus Heimdallarchaeota archaeon]